MELVEVVVRVEFLDLYGNFVEWFIVGMSFLFDLDYVMIGEY